MLYSVVGIGQEEGGLSVHMICKRYNLPVVLKLKIDIWGEKITDLSIPHISLHMAFNSVKQIKTNKSLFVNQYSQNVQKIFIETLQCARH